MTAQVHLAASTGEDPAPHSLPSGGEAYLHEVLAYTGGEKDVYRFRFVSEGFDPDESDFDALQRDLAFLCDVIALPRVADLGPEPRQLVISLADRETEFGVPAPGARQVFEAFSIEGNRCIWEMF
ncbi:hypothetical protein D6850_08580 [Roseovarius spongiae]|uniref:Acetolactate synthase n=1 Tax=Roseovarius spongiae TaxID=2320272 RepID=A0A3A8B9L9_9RHOB|nr:DUF6497 family protein [Roseovarius spongiae]RKF14913.1 hypothetical protein D6850_08580 [Roseovarius spongiae]